MLIKLNGKDYDENELAVLAKAGALELRQKNDPASATPTATPLNGPFPGNSNQYGIFSSPGVRPDRFSAQQRELSFLSALGAPVESEFQTEILEIVTGQTAAGNTNASGWCGDAPMAGGLLTCKQIFTFGNFMGKTKLNVLPQVGMLRNRADMPGRILNSGEILSPFVPDIAQRLDNSQSQLQNELYTFGGAVEISTENVAFQGVSGTDRSQFGWWKEFKGLDSQIKTGYVDADSGIACPAADSIVVTFNAAIDASASDGRDFITTMSETYISAKDRARRAGMGGTVWAWVMRAEQFYKAAEVWACGYSTYRCQSSNAGQPVTTDGMSVQALRTAMLNGQYLLVNGVEIPVIFSDGILLERIGTNPTVLRSDIYLLPISWNGRRLIRPEYFPMDNPYAAELGNFVRNGDHFKILNNGLYMVTQRDTGNCIEFIFNAMYRLILETPFLAARIDDVRFTYQLSTRVADPGITWMTAAGGPSYRN
jgi:hypothetical protein